MDKRCEECGRMFSARGNAKKYCSKKCGDKARARRAYQRSKKEKLCKTCGKPFFPTRGFRNYCSDACIVDKRKPKKTATCPVCGTEFTGRADKVYCSVQCRTYHSNNPKTPKTSPKKRVSMIDDINAQARAMGMSYGQFKALQYIQEHKANIL